MKSAPLATIIPKTKPFLKWAGGKTQLLKQITPYLPNALTSGQVKTYVEPFVGSGALFFHVAHTYPTAHFVIGDTNPELILAYRTIQQAVEPLICHLAELEKAYHQLSPEEQRAFFYTIRAQFNEPVFPPDYSQPQIERTAQFIFLNRTCFNGLFRVNAKGAFNVPFGSHKNPQICFPQRLRNVTAVLQRTAIYQGDFSQCRSFVNQDTFVYFDPPYKPISPTSGFNAYQRLEFGDEAQANLATFFRELDQTGAKLMLSNSDPQNYDPQNNFFQTLYAGFHLNKIFASRMINSQANKRGKISELLITNYESNLP